MKSFLFIVFLLIVGCQSHVPCEVTPAKKVEEPTVSQLGASSNHVRDTTGNSLGGFASGNGFSIQWQGSTTNAGATPVDVLEAVASRLRHLQKTNLGGDNVARALFDVDKAIESLSAAGLAGDQESGGAGFIAPPEGK